MSKGCNSVTLIGDPYICDYTITNSQSGDTVGDDLTFTSVIDTINRPGSPSSGNILTLPGIQAFNWYCNERATWAVGVFKQNNHVFGWNQGDGEWQVVDSRRALLVSLTAIVRRQLIATLELLGITAPDRM